MANNNQANIISNNTIVNVAVAIIHYHDQYLLGFRNHTQHQGNRYEFIGGKIEEGETAVAALIREVDEEVGIDITDNMTVKLGRLHHDYGDKQVCLQVYDVALTIVQYQQHQQCLHGLEGQALTWVDKTRLLAAHYSLPAANQTILAWLQLPKQIAITYPLEHFNTQKEVCESWLTYHQQHLPKHAWVYIRVKSEQSQQIAEQLMHLRPDIYAILPYTDSISTQFLTTTNQVVASHLMHSELMTWFNDHIAPKYAKQANQPTSLNLINSNDSQAHYPLVVSCHDASSIHAVNQLASLRLQHQLSPIIGIFLSPVLVTQTHPEANALGWESWSSLAQLADTPVIGLGGLSPLLHKQANHHGATSIAGIRQFLLS